jgi:O-antigen/teichoic acid export membrane protein
MKKIKQFIKTSSVFFIGNTLTKLISFMLLPLYTTALLPKEFGYYDLSISIISLIVPIIFFQVWDGVFRFTFDYDNKQNKYDVISNGLIISIFGVSIYSLLTFSLSFVFQIDYIKLIYFYGLLTAFQYFYNCVARSFSENYILVLSGLINSFLNLGLNFVLISYLNYGISTLYISFIVGTIVQILMLEMKLSVFKYFSLKVIRKELIIDLVKFSLPLCLLTASYWLLNGSTRLMITSKLGVYENGIFAMGNRFASLIIFAVNIFQFAWYELSYGLARDKNKNKYFNISINFVLKIVLFAGSVFLILIKLIFPLVIDEKYNETLLIMPLLYTGVLLSSFSSFAGTLFLTEKESNRLMLPTIYATLVNIICLFLFTERFGLLGATFSLFIAYLVNNLLIVKKMKSIYEVKLNSKILFFGISIYILSVFIYYNISDVIALVITIILLTLITIFIFKDEFLLLKNNIRN